MSAVNLEKSSIRGRLNARSARDLLRDRTDPVKRAAVASVLRPAEAGPEVLLIRRAEHPRDPWSGHMAFPGGRQDPEDADLLATAHRETLEEVGLDLAGAELLGRGDDLEAIAQGKRAGLVVRPFVFWAPNAETGPMDASEVAEALWAPIVPLLRGERDTTYPYEHEGQRLRFPAYDIDGRIVWGLTHRMLTALFARFR
ncbi:MAG: CoA pyrophosphatase [Myxococcota bacterium]